MGLIRVRGFYADMATLRFPNEHTKRIFVAVWTLVELAVMVGAFKLLLYLGS